MNEEKLQEAISLYNQGNKSQAAILLGEIVRQDPDNSTAWYGLALSVTETNKKIYCLRKVIDLDPAHAKALQLLEKLQPTGKLQPAEKLQPIEKPHPSNNNSTTSTKPQEPLGRYKPLVHKSAPGRFVKKTLNESTTLEKKLIFILAGMVVLLVFCGVSVGITALVRKQCSERFENDMVSLLSQFFRQQSIADVTARINLPEQISRLEDIRNETWNMSDKSCQSKAHSYLMNFMDESIASYVAFSGEYDSLSNQKYLDSVDALSKLDDEVIRVFDKGGLISLFRSKGYFYWEGLDNPKWKDQLDG